MKTLLAATIFVLSGVWSAAGEPVEAPAAPPKSALETLKPVIRTARIRRVEAEIATDEKFLVGAQKQEETIKALMVKHRIEIRWLKGELTRENTEAAVKAAQESFDKLKADKKPTEEAGKALASATFDRDEVKRLEFDVLESAARASESKAADERAKARKAAALGVDAAKGK